MLLWTTLYVYHQFFISFYDYCTLHTYFVFCHWVIDLKCALEHPEHGITTFYKSCADQMFILTYNISVYIHTYVTSLSNKLTFRPVWFLWLHKMLVNECMWYIYAFLIGWGIAQHKQKRGPVVHGFQKCCVAQHYGCRCPGFKHQAIINKTDPSPAILYPYYKRWFALIALFLELNTFERKWSSNLQVTVSTYSCWLFPLPSVLLPRLLTGSVIYGCLCRGFSALRDCLIKLRPVSLTFSHRSCTSVEISFCSHIDSNKAITTKFLHMTRQLCSRNMCENWLRSDGQ